jgi:hypothetical protein
MESLTLQNRNRVEGEDETAGHSRAEGENRRQAPDLPRQELAASMLYSHETHWETVTMKDHTTSRPLIIASMFLLLGAAVAACPAWAAQAPAAAFPAAPATPAARPAAQASIGQRLGVRPAAQRLAPDCSDGIHYDDGTFEDAVSAPVPGGLQVMSFTLPANAIGILQVCAALTRVADAPSPNLDFNVVFYGADGPGGTPGTLLASVPATATAIPVTTNTINAQFYPVGIGAALTLPEARQIYVGLQFDGSQGYFIGVDNSSTTPYQPTYASTDGGATWQSEPTVDGDAYSAFGIRVDPQLAQTNCIASTTALCLQSQRFQVSANFRTAGGQAGAAETVPLTTDTGYLWFFDSTNVEAVIKVLDGCALNQHFWVFAGGLTNVRTAITVTDTQTGIAKTYDNPLNTPFQPLQDTSAFACP